MHMLGKRSCMVFLNGANVHAIQLCSLAASSTPSSLRHGLPQGDQFGQGAPARCRQPLPMTSDGKPGRLFDGLRCAMAWWPPLADSDGETHLGWLCSTPFVCPPHNFYSWMLPAAKKGDMVQRLLVAGGACLEELPPEVAAAAADACVDTSQGVAVLSCDPVAGGSGLHIIGHTDLTPACVAALTAYCGMRPLLYNWVFDSVSWSLGRACAL